jgi:hypothetical protein
MKQRPNPKRPNIRYRQTGIKSGEVLKNFTTEQLAGIGATAMAYNEAILTLDAIVGQCLGFPGDAHEVTSRINGIDGKFAVIRAAAAQLELATDSKENISTSLGALGFAGLKTFRDAVIHSCIVDVASCVGRVDEGRGNRSDVLLSEEALEWLYVQIALLREELEAIHTVFACTQRLSRLPVPSAEHKARLERSIQDANLQCRSHLLHRQSLWPPPKFPEESETSTLTLPERRARLRS